MLSRPLLLLLAVSCLFGLATSQIRVLEPKSLANKFRKSKIEGSTAAFGTPMYDDRIIGRLSWNASRGGNFCTAEDYDVAEAKTAPGLPVVIIVRRGDCDFVVKVKTAQEKGAAAVIVVDQAAAGRTVQDIMRIIPADNGWGNTVRVPSLLVTSGDGEQLIDAVEGSLGDVVVELAWDLPKDNVVTMDYWFAPSHAASMRFLKAYAPYAKQLGGRIEFRPHWWVYSLPTSDFNSLCTDSSGLFCMDDPDMAGPVTGKDAIEESLREMCLWETAGKRDATGLAPPNAALASEQDVASSEGGYFSGAWWQYMSNLLEECPFNAPAAENRFGEACSYRLMDKMGVDTAAVKQCTLSQRDAFLQRELTTLAWAPQALRINEYRYSGPVDPVMITRAACSAYEPDQIPDACDALLNPSKVEMDEFYAKEIAEAKTKGKGVPWWVYFVSVLGVLVLALAAFLAYRYWVVNNLRKSLRYEVMEEVRTQMLAQNNGDSASSGPNGPASFDIEKAAEGKEGLPGYSRSSTAASHSVAGQI